VLLTKRVEVTFTDVVGTTTAPHIHCCTAVAGISTAIAATMAPTFTGFPLGVASGSPAGEIRGFLELDLKAVPEPGTMLLAGAALAGLICRRRLR
jgi:hypothetical protein